MHKLLTLINFLWSFVVLVSLPFTVNAQVAEDYLSSQTPSAWVKSVALNLADFAPTSQEAVDYLIVDRQYRTEGSQSERYLHFVTRLNSSAAVENNSSLSITFDPSYEKVVLHRVQVHRGNSSRDLLDLSAFDIYRVETERDRLIYNGRLQLSYLLPDVRVGDIVDYSFSVVGKNPALGKHVAFSAQHGFAVPVHFKRDRFLFPADYPVFMKSYTGAPAPEKLSEGGFEIYEWVHNDVPGIIAEQNQPAGQPQYPETYVSSFRDWSEVGRFFAPHYDVRGPKPAELVEVATGIKENHSDPKDQVRAALAFVQSEIRYMGIELGAGGYIPRAPQQVLERRFGDCKDMVTLLNALLDELGIKSAPILVSANLRKAVEVLPASHGAFDHVIAMVTLGGSTYFLDPTRGEQLGDLDHLQQGDFGKGVVIGVDGIGLVDVAPEGPEYFKKFTDRFVSDPQLDSMSFVSTSEYFMGAADEIYEDVKYNGLDRMDRNFLDYYQNFYPGLERRKPLEMKVFEDEGRVMLVGSYFIPEAWTRNEDDKDFRTITISPNDLLYEIPDFDGETRKTPYQISHPIRIHYEQSVLMGDEWTADPFRQVFDHPSLRYEITQRFHANTLTKTYAYVSKSDTIAPEDFEATMASLRVIHDESGVIITDNTNPSFWDNVSDEEFETYFFIYLAIVLSGSVLGGYFTGKNDLDWRKDQTFYPVSLLKFVVLNIVTVGYYQIYWAYKNWLWVHEKQGEKVSPMLYAFFSNLTNFSLFPRFATTDGKGYSWFSFVAIPLAILVLLASVMDRYVGTANTVPTALLVINFLTVLLPVPAAMQVLKLNEHSPTYIARNSRFSLPVLLMILAYLPIFALMMVGAWELSV